MWVCMAGLAAVVLGMDQQKEQEKYGEAVQVLISNCTNKLSQMLAQTPVEQMQVVAPLSSLEYSFEGETHHLSTEGHVASLTLEGQGEKRKQRYDPVFQQMLPKALLTTRFS